MVIKGLIIFTMSVFQVLGLSVALAQPPISAQELIETTELKQSLKQLEEGEIVLLTRPQLENDSELHVAMSLLVPAPLKATVEKMQQLASGSDTPGILTVQEIKGTPTPAQLATAFSGVAFEPAEAKEVQYMLEDGENSEYNLSKDEITMVKNKLGATASNVDGQVALLNAMSDAMREILKNRYLAYTQRGLDGVSAYRLSDTEQVNPSEELIWATESMAVVKNRFPDYYQCLRYYPQQCAPNLIHQFFWMKQSDGKRPMFVLKHWVLDVQEDYALITERQFYLSHTLNSMQVVIGCLPYGDGTLVVLLNQAFTEMVNPAIGKKIAKAVGYKQVEKNIRPIFDALRAAFNR